MPAAVGRSFGNFRVTRLIGEGGFGEVYEAENPFLQRRAAIKLLHTGMGENPDMVKRFLMEARAASGIRHPNIIDILDACVTPEGEPYITMEYLDGESLQARLTRGRLPLELALHIARQAGSALAAAHASGIVHRDLKPENLFLVPEPTSRFQCTVKVLDFGIAKMKQRDMTASVVKTQAGLLMGSPAYMSPEQCRDSSDVDHRSDIYSLGLIAYEMLAGEGPFSSTSAVDMLVMQMMTPPVPLRSRVPEVPPHVADAVMKALAKDRNQRQDTVASFVRQLLGTESALTPAPITGTMPAVTDDDDLPLPGQKAGALVNTTLSRVAGESVGDDVEETVLINRRRWPVFAGIAGAVVVGIGLALLLRAQQTASVPEKQGQPNAAATGAIAQVHARVQSSPAGAAVIDTKDGTTLGITPMDKVMARQEGTMNLVLRLPGHKDKPLLIPLDKDSSAMLTLEAVPAPEAPKPAAAAPATAAPTAAKPAAAAATKPEAAGTRKPRKNTKDEEDLWRVH